MLIAGIILYAISFTAMGFCSQLWQFYVLGILKGMGAAFSAFVVVSILINNWFVKSHGLITSVIFAFSGVAGALLSPVLSNVIANFGWRNGYFLCGAIVLLFSFPAFFYPFSLTPQGCNRTAYGAGLLQESKEKSMAAVSKQHRSLKLALVLFFFCAVNFIGAYLQIFSSFTLSIGFDYTIAGLVVSAGMVGNIFSKFAFGILADRIGTYKTNCLIGLINMAGALLLLCNGGNAFLLLLGSFLFGFVLSNVTVGVVLLIGDVFDKEEYDSIYPIFSFISNIFFAFSGMIVGFVYDTCYSYTPALLAALFLMVLNLAAIALLAMFSKKESELILEQAS
jgi:MFS family permease